MEKEIINFVNNELSTPNKKGINLLIDSFALMYIKIKAEKKNTKDNLEFSVLVDFFKKIGVIPKLNKEGEIVYINRENINNNTNKETISKFFKKKNNYNNNNYNNNNYNNNNCKDCILKNVCSENQIEKEKELIKDILFNFNKEMNNLVCIFDN